MDLRKKYNEFYKERFSDVNITPVEIKYLDLLKKKLNNLVLANKDSNYDGLLRSLEEEIKSITSIKTNYINVYYKFLDYLKKQNINYECSYSKTYLTETRRIELIKYFHEPHTEEDVLKDFMINNRTFRSDLKALKDGIDFCGCKLKIQFNRYDRDGKITIDDKGYHSSYNPFGLVLNMTELYLLTNIIPKMIKDYRIRGEYSDIINKIYPQLSKYAIKLVNKEYYEDNMGNFEEFNSKKQFVLESQSMKDNAINQLMYVFKTGKPCTIIYSTLRENAKIEGYIKFHNDNSFIVENLKGETQEILFDDFISIDDFFEDVYE